MRSSTHEMPAWWSRWSAAKGRSRSVMRCSARLATRHLSAGRRLQLHAAVTTGLDAPPIGSGRPVRARSPRLPRRIPRRSRPWPSTSPSRPAGRAPTVGDHVEAAQHFQRALDVIDLVPERDEHQRLALTIRLGEAVAPTDMPRGHAILRDAARLARRLGEPAAFADAVCSMAVELGSVSPGRDDPAFLALADEALSNLPDERDALARASVRAGRCPPCAGKPARAGPDPPARGGRRGSPQR